ncbi:MAG: PorV/PorQ family protein [Ignavibacteriaceae bacterium]
MKKITLFIAFMFLTKVSAQVFSGTTSGQFLKIDVGAKAVSMGGAFVAEANDVSSLFWNPAGISYLPYNSTMFSHGYWLADTKHDFAGLVFKFGNNQAVGLSYTVLNYGEMKVRTEIYPEGTGEFFSASDYSLALSYAFRITEDFGIGFTGKYIGQQIWNMNASNLAFDIGVLYRTPIKGLNLGMSVSNISSKVKFAGKDNFIYYSYDPTKKGASDKIFAEIKMDEWDLPLFYRVGISAKLIDDEIHALTLNVDANHPNDYSESVNTGAEYAFKERIFLRVGYKALFKKESQEGLNAGIGFVYYFTDYVPLHLDYAYSDFGILGSIQRVGVELGF